MLCFRDINLQRWPGRDGPLLALALAEFELLQEVTEGPSPELPSVLLLAKLSPSSGVELEGPCGALANSCFICGLTNSKFIKFSSPRCRKIPKLTLT